MRTVALDEPEVLNEPEGHIVWLSGVHMLLRAQFRGWLGLRLVLSLVIAATLSLLGPVPGHALAAGDHEDPRMVDVDTPVYVGYSQKLRAYHFYVTGRWRPVCDGEYCWPAIGDGSSKDLGSNDAVRINFSDAVHFKKFAIHNFDVCGRTLYYRSRKVTSNSYENAYAGVDDKTFVGWKETTWNGETTTSGTCKEPTEPTASQGAGGSGGSGGVKFWADLAGRSFRYDVWVNPAPSRGRCYDRLYVMGGYTHTWSKQGLTWGLGYPLGVGVGVVEGNDHFTVTQATDGIADPDLKTPRLCRH